MEKPENVIEYRKYVEPHTFENDREAILFYSYIEAHEYIDQLQSELEKANELIKLGIGWATDQEGSSYFIDEATTFLEGSGNKTK